MMTMDMRKRDYLCGRLIFAMPTFVLCNVQKLNELIRGSQFRSRNGWDQKVESFIGFSF